MNLRSRTIRLASAMPKNSSVRKALLEILASSVSQRVAELLPFDYDGILVGVNTGQKTPSGMDRYDNKRYSVPLSITASGVESAMLQRGSKFPGQMIKLYGLIGGRSDALLIWTRARGFEVPDYMWEANNLRNPTRKEVARWINGRGPNPALL